MSLKLGKFGAFVGCDKYPDCRYTRPLVLQNEDGEDGENAETVKLSNEPKELGPHPDTGRTVSLRKGPYGPYVQIDEPPESKDKPKRQALPRGINPADMDLAAALKLLALPREIGKHPETGDMIKAGIGRFGPFLLHQKKFTSIPKNDDVLTIGMNRAVTVMAEAAERREKKEAAKETKKKTAKKETSSTKKKKKKTG